MPLIRTIQIDPETRLGVWSIEEQESFFRERVNISPEIHHPHKRLQHFAGRYLLVTLFPEFPIEKIQISGSRKPVLTCDSYHFSISHCGDHVAAIVSTKAAVGIDIEEVKDKIEKVSHKFLSPDERDFIDPTHALPHKTICWSAKEAMFKWYGLGSVDFRENLVLQPFVYQPMGFISANFVKPDSNTRLYLQYIIENGLCLAWTHPA
ncbi:4'-phosphopantetheinyl transferase superfamily protein [Chitinophaga sp. HK235]|uniref:4'-phosphopantetheinyl transferase family protein n=1 Tax=Chitinophaga sp. HK235 TaxID=2952571 RepID=UPI001BAAC579|nr:4'-phosphopantetheinyl transferase superfamily protein [Chitinophaga sp. HK235]